MPPTTTTTTTTTQRKKNPLHQRRRARNSHDNDQVFDDSQSDQSLPSDVDDDADADYSDLSEPDQLDNKSSNLHPKKSILVLDALKSSAQQVDTNLLRNPVQSSTTSKSSPPTEPIDFDQMDKSNDKKPRTNEEYRRRLESDPAFIPTRGSFFMHEQRNNSQRGARGRGNGPFQPHNPRQQEPSSSQWSHDLHETLLEPQSNTNSNTNTNTNTNTNASGPSKITRLSRNFSTTQLLGKVPVRISLPGMVEPKTLQDLAVNRYTKLPTHRPPLRRDKPVRISLPDHPVRYIFPNIDRSFVFIPRNLRPNQQGFGKSLAKLGGYSSRRTSIYGGSMYSPSVAMSRRSSLVGSPAGSMISSRPVVRLPPGSTGTPIYPSGPFIPPRRENWSGNLPIHQPRPQKAISVSGFELPSQNDGNVEHDPNYQANQPFHHQYNETSGFNSNNHHHQQQQQQQQQQQPQHHQHHQHQHHQRQHSYPIHPQNSMTPLSNIPERAIHAQPYQPYQAGPYGYTNQPAYFYPTHQPIQPVFIPQQPQDYMIQPNQQQSVGYVAHEQNGMVYYFDPNQMQNDNNYQQGNPIPVMQPFIQPPPENYFYPQPAYYTPQ